MAPLSRARGEGGEFMVRHFAPGAISPFHRFALCPLQHVLTQEPIYGIDVDTFFEFELEGLCFTGDP